MRHLKLVHPIEPAPTMRVKIAFASSDHKKVDQHFGAAEAFVLYELSADAARMLEVVQFTDSDTMMDGHDGKLAGRISLLAGCAAVYCNAVGASAVRQLLAAGIQPIKVAEGEPIDALLCQLKHRLNNAPPAWLAKHLKRTDASDRFAAMEKEGWEE